MALFQRNVRPLSRNYRSFQQLRFSSPALARDDDDVSATIEFSSVPENLGSALTPPDTVKLLDQYIIGQPAAKRAVAIAMRNRWRRQKLPDDLKAEVIPKNILMVGPTGCGKTEIARRISKLTHAPFIKVEATKFTEVGFHGKDVDQIIKDLVENSILMTKKQQSERLKNEVSDLVEDRIIAELIGDNSTSEQSFRELYRHGSLDTRKIVIQVNNASSNSNDLLGVDMSQMPDNLAKLLGQAKGKGGGGVKEKKMLIKDAKVIIEEQEMERLMEGLDIKKLAIEAVEEGGIVFIDEIDKICHAKGKHHTSDASSEGVQRDLLPLIEGSSIATKHGDVNTDHILFIASGAFHACKPSDILAELQGRLPIRVSLDALSEDDMYRILTEPVTNLIKQQIELMKTENIDLVVEDDAIREMAKVATKSNQLLDNIGARRLHTIVEKVMEHISFDAPDMEPGSTFVVDKTLVSDKVSSMLIEKNLQKFIL